MVTTLSDQQHGVFSRTQLVGGGIARTTVDSKVRRGQWSRVAGGVYRLTGRPLSPAGVLTAARLIDPDVVVSHLTAARLHHFTNLPTQRADDVAHLTTAASSTPNGPWRIHRATALPRDQCVHVGDWRCTSRERTILDVAGMVSVAHLERIVDAQLVSGSVSVKRLCRVLDASGSGRRGVRALRSLLNDRTSAPNESELEAWFVRLVSDAGLPSPIGQYRTPWASEGGVGRVDFAYPDACLAIELDGKRWHSDARSFESDRRRDQRAIVHGWRTVRFTWKQVTETPGDVLDVLRSLLANAA